MTTTVDFDLRVGGVIEVNRGLSTMPAPELYDSRGVQIAGPTSHLFQSSVSLFSGLPDGVYYVRIPRDPSGQFRELSYGGLDCGACPVTSSTAFVVRAGETVKGIAFIPLAARAISGTVRDTLTSDPLSTITVDVLSASGQLVASSVTDRLGRFVVSGLAPGTYYARTVNTRGYVDVRYDDVACGPCGASGSTPIVVTQDADVTNVNFTLVAATHISGSVTTTDGLIVTSAPVSLLTQTGVVVARGLSDRLGQFTFAAPPGTYAARVEPIAAFRQQLYQSKPCPRGQCDLNTAQPIAVASSLVTGIDFRLEACTPLTVAPVQLATAAATSPYRQTITAGGGTGPFGFAVIAGVLPSGLTLDSTTGVLSGTPGGPGRFTFTIAASDSTGCAGTREYTLDVPACRFMLNGPASLAAVGQTFVSSASDTCGSHPPPSSTESWLHVGAETPSIGGTQMSVVADPNPGSAPRTGSIAWGPRGLLVVQSGSAVSPPFGFVDSPTDGAQVEGSLAISGWALDDVAVTRVEIYRDSVTGEANPLVFVGNATFVDGARPDVETTYPLLPGNRRAGWGYLVLTNMLPNRGNGTFRLHAYAVDSDDNRVLLGSRTIVASNDAASKPFGTIDTPEQGGTASGTNYVSFGWALTPKPRTIPMNGSSIRVFVDGVDIGPLTGYNFFRPDVSNLFPSLNNSAGPVGFHTFDTTALDDGLHTIAWVVTDDGGEVQGIGSRYFRVSNSAWTPLPSAASASRSSATSSNAVRQPPISRGSGVDLFRHVASLDELPVATDGSRNVTLWAMQRLELRLSDRNGADCAATYTGYAVEGSELRETPVGSSLDPAGTFYWQPGPGFIGTYPLLFIRAACDGTRERLTVNVTIVNK